CFRARLLFFFSSRRRHTRFSRDWSSDVCSSDLKAAQAGESGLDRNPVGTGPWKFGSWTSNDTLVFERNADYWQDGVAGVDTLNRSEERRVGREGRSGSWAYVDI